ncbi:alkaline phosphatase synthesis sensor protein PhoR [mine drainage metagenome]|uniref:histidine kinase n=1 Tax=mine drainage metagenome TaxID=410659 RepID=A0A1J5PKA4_9ZZZZ
MRGVIGDAAHQLRTPVTALLSQMELLSMQSDDQSREKHLKRLAELTQRLGELVNQLINHAMVQHRADSVAMERIDLVGLARLEMTDMLSHQAHRNLDLEFDAPDAPCFIDGDPVTVREAVKNLLDNALKYGARTLLHISIRRAGADWELTVEDDGPGLAEAHWERVRKPFSARGGHRHGASLGLSIVEEVMRAHRGDMRFGRSANQRFTVTLRFPAVDANQQGP